MKYPNLLRSLSHVIGAFSLALCSLSSPTLGQSQANQPWIPTWGMAPAGGTLLVPFDKSGMLTLSDQTVRMIVHTSVGGNTARLRFSNRLGTSPITISDIHIAQSTSATGSTSIVSSSDHKVTFGGATSVTIPAGQDVASDSIAYAIPPSTDLAVSVYFPKGNSYGNLTAQYFSWQENWYGSGDVSGVATMTPITSTPGRFFLTGVDVQNTALTGTLVAFGASITEGYEDLNAGTSLNNRWTDLLSTILSGKNINVGISNSGISGEGLLSGSNTSYFGPGGLNRFMADVVMKPNVRWVVISDEPINDLQNASITADSLEAGMTQIVNQAHAAQIKVICSTLTPFKGTGPRWSPMVEVTREAINAWIQTSASGCDGIFDQASAVADPADPTMYTPQYDSGDHLHPNAAGYAAIAAAFNVNLLNMATPLAPSDSSTACGTLTSGQTLQLGQSLLSCDGRFTLALGSDGNLTVNQGASQLYSSSTAGKNITQGELRPNGAFVLFDNNGRPIWATNADHYPGSKLVMQNDGNVVIRNASGGAIWNTATCCH